MLDVLPSLIKQGKEKQHKDRLLGLLQQYNTCQDEHILYRLYRVASKLLEPKQMREELLAYQGQLPDVVAKVCLVWPYSLGIDMKEAALQASYWEGIPDSLWAEWWWYTVITSNFEATEIPASPALHPYLLEQFATNPFPTSIDAIHEMYFYYKLSRTPWVVWKLYYYQSIVNPTSRIFPKHLYKRLFSYFETVPESDFSGIDKSMQKVIKDLLTIMHDLKYVCLSDDSKG